mgnify:FL=1
MKKTSINFAIAPQTKIYKVSNQGVVQGATSDLVINKQILIAWVDVNNVKTAGNIVVLV